MTTAAPARTEPHALPPVEPRPEDNPAAINPANHSPPIRPNPVTPGSGAQFRAAEVSYSPRVQEAVGQVQGAQRDVGGVLMDNPALSPAERNAVVQSVARNDGLTTRAGPFFPSKLTDPGVAQQQSRLTAEAVNDALAQGAINQGDLVKIADQSGAGPQQLIGVLDSAPRSSDANASLETLGQGLWNRADENQNKIGKGPGQIDPDTPEGKGLQTQIVQDRAGATIAFSSDPALASRNLNTPEKRLQAFESLVNQTDQNRSAPGDNEVLERQQQSREYFDDIKQYDDQVKITAASLFNNNAREIVDAYTSADTASRGGGLRQFINQEMYDPQTAGVTLSNGQGVTDSVIDSLGRVTTDIRTEFDAGSLNDRKAAARQYGYLASDIKNATIDAAQQYATDVGQVAEKRKAFTSVAESAAGLLVDPVTEKLGPLSGVVGDAVNGLIEGSLEELASGIYPDAEKPKLAVGDGYLAAGRAEIQARTAGTDYQQELLDSYESAFASNASDTAISQLTKAVIEKAEGDKGGG